MQTPADNTILKNLLREELGYLPGDATIDAFLDAGEYRTYRKWDIIMEEGKVCSDILVMKEGVARFFDLNGEKDRTFAFATPGSIMTSKYSFVMDRPSYYTVDAITPCTVWGISKQTFWDFVKANHEMALYMLHYAYGELFFQEYRNREINNGAARDRYLNMVRTRAEVIEAVPQKIIASYLNITPEYLSKLKKEFEAETGVERGNNPFRENPLKKP